MNKHEEIRARLAGDKDWGVYDGALSRDDLACLSNEYSVLSVDRNALRDENERLKAGWCWGNSSGYSLSYADGIYCVTDMDGHILCEVDRAEMEGCK